MPNNRSSRSNLSRGGSNSTKKSGVGTTTTQFIKQNLLPPSTGAEAKRKKVPQSTQGVAINKINFYKVNLKSTIKDTQPVKSTNFLKVKLDKPKVKEPQETSSIASNI